MRPAISLSQQGCQHEKEKTERAVVLLAKTSQFSRHFRAVIFLGTASVTFHGFSGLFYSFVDVAQAAASSRIGDLATALTGLDPLSDYSGNIRCSLRSNILPDGLLIEVEAVAQRYRVFFLLNANPNGKLTGGDDLLPRRRHINNVAVRRGTEKTWPPG